MMFSAYSSCIICEAYSARICHIIIFAHNINVHFPMNLIVDQFCYVNQIEMTRTFVKLDSSTVCIVSAVVWSVVCILDDSREMPTYTELMHDASLAIAQVQKALNNRQV